ncbi:unnamed protein product [Schistosoma mattheei]|uniref:Uncharacterized protein n=1 Tax=Schistosoma mattheei TaxID=31246 RepID=A0A183Q3A3_9TREM|nr:unnamed protein product [Schistosoma mattheei]
MTAMLPSHKEEVDSKSAHLALSHGYPSPAVCLIDPNNDTSWKELMKSNKHIQTDGVHMKDQLNPNSSTPELLSEAVKLLKGEYVIRAIKQQNMDRALIFCRTKLDCDNLEQYFISMGGGESIKYLYFLKNIKLVCSVY